MEGPRGAADRLLRGIEAGGMRMYVKGRSPGRFPEEEDMEVFAERPRGEERLLFLKLYHGRPGRFPWAELHTIFSRFHGFPAEDALLVLLAAHLGPGGAVYVEYEGDEETKGGLLRGVPPPATRLGAVLFRAGFTWFKDWYFAEGFLEGGRKLQGEKPLDGEARKRHLAAIRKELTEFLGQAHRPAKKDVFMSKACDRALKTASEIP